MDFPGGPGIESPSSNAGDADLISDWGTKIPHAMGDLSLHTANRVALTLQLEKPLDCTATKTSTAQKKEETEEQKLNCHRDVHPGLLHLLAPLKCGLHSLLLWDSHCSRCQWLPTHILSLVTQEAVPFLSRIRRLQERILVVLDGITAYPRVCGR